MEPSVIQEGEESQFAGSEVVSQVRSNRLMQITPEQSNIDHNELRRKSRKHIDFQHEGHIDFKFIENVKVGERAQIGEDNVKYIKNASESAVDSQHVQNELIHLRHLGTDGKSIRSYRDIKDIKFKYEADDEAKYSAREEEPKIHINYVEVDESYLTPKKELGKQRTKTEQFEPTVTQNIPQTERIVKKTQDQEFTSQDSIPTSKKLPTIEPVLDIQSSSNEKQESSIHPVETPESKMQDKKQAKPVSSRLKNKPGYNNNLVDQLLDFGAPKPQKPVQIIQQQVQVRRFGFADRLIQDVKETNRIIQEQKARQT